MTPREYQPAPGHPILQEVIRYTVAAFEHNIVTGGHTHGDTIAYSRDMTTFTEAKWIPR